MEILTCTVHVQVSVAKKGVYVGEEESMTITQKHS